MIKVLITGAHGQVGAELVQHARAIGMQVLGFSREELDIRSCPMIEAIVSEHRPDIVINAAAYTNVERAEDDTVNAYAINAEAVGYLADACHRYHIPLLHISTDYVFSGDKTTPYIETDATQPLSVYGASKLAGEVAIIDRMQQYIILRTSWVFSATGHNFVKTMYRLFHEKDEVSVVNDQWGSPTSARSIAEALLIIAQRVLAGNFHAWGVYHFSGDCITTWYDFAEAIRSACGNTLKIQTLRPIASQAFPSKVKRPQYGFLCSDRIKQVFSISPCDWQRDMQQTIQQLKGVFYNEL